MAEELYLDREDVLPEFNAPFEVDLSDDDKHVQWKSNPFHRNEVFYASRRKKVAAGIRRAFTPDLWTLFRQVASTGEGVGEFRRSLEGQVDSDGDSDLEKRIPWVIGALQNYASTGEGSLEEIEDEVRFLIQPRGK